MQKKKQNLSAGIQKILHDVKNHNVRIENLLETYPGLRKSIVYCLLLGGLVMAGGPTIEKGLFGKSASGVHNNDDDEDEKVTPNTYGAYLEYLRPVIPFLVANLIAEEGVNLDEHGLHKPYLCSSGVWTIGFGSTVLKDGTKVTKNTRHITTEEAYDLAVWHIEKESFFLMYCYDIAFDDFNIDNVGKAIGLGSVFYNSASKLIEPKQEKNHKERFTQLRNDFKKFGYALSDSLVKQRFKQFPVKKMETFGEVLLKGKKANVVADKIGNFLSGGGGMRWRRWLEAGLITGEITPQMILDCPIDGMSEFYKYMGGTREKFFTGEFPNRQVNKNTYKIFRQWIENPVTKKKESLSKRKKISDFLPPDALEYCRKGHCELGSKVKTRKASQKETYVLSYNDFYESALGAFKKKDYKSAAKQYENMIQNYPDDALLRNDLAATYNKLGKYDKAIEQARYVIHNIGDKKQYAAAQYNAGYAYEQQGNLQKALDNYTLAVENGNVSVKKDVQRVKNTMKKQTFSKASTKIEKKNNAKLSVVKSANIME